MVTTDPIGGGAIEQEPVPVHHVLVIVTYVSAAVLHHSNQKA